jgi:hypothetical protein
LNIALKIDKIYIDSEENGWHSKLWAQHEQKCRSRIKILKNLLLRDIFCLLLSVAFIGKALVTFKL